MKFDHDFPGASLKDDSDRVLDEGFVPPENGGAEDAVFVGTPPPRPLGALVALPLTSNFALSFCEELADFNDALVEGAER